MSVASKVIIATFIIATLFVMSQINTTVVSKCFIL